MKSRALVVWVIVMLLFGMAIGAQAESAEDTIFSSGDWRYRVRWEKGGGDRRRGFLCPLL